VSTEIYPLEAIRRACYQLTENCYVQIEPEGQVVRIRLAAKNADRLPANIQGELSNALIDYSLRLQIAEETAAVREQLVRTALAEALGVRR
jgi:His-Xaa-Ser system protein HxsD